MSHCEIVLDIRCASTEAQKQLVTAVLDALLGLDAADSLLIITNHDPSGIAYSVDLRRETRGKFHFSSEERADGSFVTTFRRV